MALRDVCDVELRAGDVLLLEADQSFRKRFQANPAFGLVSPFLQRWQQAAVRTGSKRSTRGWQSHHIMQSQRTARPY